MEDHELLKFLITGKRIYLINSSNRFNYFSNKVSAISVSRQNVSLQVDGGTTQFTFASVVISKVKKSRAQVVS